MVFDPRIDAVLAERAKAALRKRMRGVRLAIPEAARAARSERIVERMKATEAFARAERIGLFFPLIRRGEVDLRALDRDARAEGKRVLYPRMKASEGDMVLAYATPEELEDRGNGFFEPPADAECGDPGPELLVVVPALAIAPTGHRIGYGRGNYDRLLRDLAPPSRTLGVAFDFQLCAEVPTSPFDRAVDTVVTDERTFDATEATQPER